MSTEAESSVSVPSGGRPILLVGVDFSEPSLEALDVARGLADNLGLEVVLAHVHAIPVVSYPGLDPMVAPGGSEQVAKAARGALDDLARSLGGLRTILRDGDVAQELLAVVDEVRPSMVALGTHGRTGLARLLLGSVAEKVLRASAAPVLVVRARATD